MEPTASATDTARGRDVRKKRKYLIVDSVPWDPEMQALALLGRSFRELVAEVAYYKAERRGFGGGDSVRDWIEAEAEVDDKLRRGPPF